MSQKKEMCNYTILSDQAVTEIYKNAYENYSKEVVRFYEEHKPYCTICLDETLLLKELKKTFLFLNKYNIEPSDYLIKIIEAQSIHEIHEVQQKLNEYSHAIKNEISPLIAIGKAKRDLYGIQFPEIFQQDRIYLKTNPILSETELMEDLVEFLNYPLLRQEKFSFNCEVVTTETKKGKTKHAKRFWLIQKQPIKPIGKLKDWEKECRTFHGILKENPSFLSLFFKFIQETENDENLSSLFNKFKKSEKLPFCRLDTVVLRHLKAYQLKNEEHLLFALDTIANQFKMFHTSLNDILTKESNSNDHDEGIDMIILSTRPHDIATMSTFADWESCMSIGGLYFQDIMMQIGAGSIIAYGVNSKNPEKKLARVLLKPFETAKTHMQRSNYCNEIADEFSLPEITINPTLQLDYADMYAEKIKFMTEETAHLDESDLVLDPKHVERIYKIDKIYGLQNPAFGKILTEFARHHLNTPSLHGTVMVVDPMYLDGLQHSYQIYDKKDKDNLIKYLIDRRLTYHFDCDNVTHIDYLDVANVENIYLRPLSTKHLTVDGYMLDRPIEYIATEKLLISNAHTFKSKTFPKNITVRRSLHFQDTHKEFHMPFGIVAPEILAAGTGLLSIAPDVKTNVLNISNTKISDLPTLRLQSLDVSFCERLTHLPSDLSVKNKLIIDYSPITCLPAVSTSLISAKYAKNLKKLHPDIHFTHFKGAHSGLEVMPENLQASSFIAPNTFIRHIPKGTKIKEIDLKNTPLETIDADVEISTLLISNTPIKKIPNNLNFYKLDVSLCPNLKKLPEDISVSWSLNANNSGLTGLPVLDTENIAIMNCPNIKTLPENIRFKKLLANHSGIKSLPENLDAQIISLSYSELKSLPNNTTATQMIDVKQTPLSSIGENLSTGILIISGTPIKSLPSSMHVDQLEAIGCKELTDMPSHIVISQKINISDTNVSNLNHIQTKNLIVSNCKNLQSLDESVVFENLTANHSGLMHLADHTTAQKINIMYCPINELPEDLSVLELEASHANLQKLPSDLKAGFLNIDSTHVSEIPENIQVKKLVMTNTHVHTIHYSEHFSEIIVNHPVQCIHPNIDNSIIKGMSDKDIKLAKNRYRRCQQQLIAKMANDRIG